MQRSDSQLRGRGHPWSLSHYMEWDVANERRVTPHQWCKAFDTRWIESSIRVYRKTSKTKQTNQKKKKKNPDWETRTRSKRKTRRDLDHKSINSSALLCFLLTKPYSCFIQFKSCRLLEAFWSYPNKTSVQFSCSVVSDSLWPHESQHARPPCPSPTPRVHSDSRSSSQWCHSAISSSVVPFFSCPQSLPASQSFPMSQLFTWGGQSTGASALASFLPKTSQGLSPSEWTDWISLQSKGFSRVFSNTTVQKHQLFGAQPSSQSNSHIHTWPQEKP